MPSFLAALGVSQLKKTDWIIEKRRANAQYLIEQLLQTVAERICFQDVPKEYFHVYQLFTLKVKKHRDELMKYLSSKGIMTKVYFSPVHLASFYRDKLKYRCDLPNTERIAKQVLTLPMYPELTKKEMDYSVESISEFYKERP